MLSSRVQGNVTIDPGTDTTVYGDGDLTAANNVTAGKTLYAENGSDPDSIMHLQHESVGVLNHMNVRYTFNYNDGDPFNIGVDNDEPKMIWSMQSTMYRQGMMFGDTGSGTTTVFGIGTSSNDGVSWDPRFVVKQNGLVGINKNNPSVALDVDGDASIDGKLTVTGLIDPTGLVLDEQSEVPEGATAPGKGTVWVKDDSPNFLVFTDNTGTDHGIGPNVTQPLTNKTIGSATNTVEATHLRNVPITSTAPTSNQQLIFNGSMWTPEDQYNPDTTVTFFDDFLGAEIGDTWIVNKFGIGSSAVIVDGVGGQVKIQSGDDAGEYAEINTFTKCVDKYTSPNLKFRLKLSHITNTNVSLGYKDTNDEKVEFYYNVSTADNWFTRTTAGGTSTNNDSGVAATTNWMLFQIIGTESDVKFYINGALVATHNTNLSDSLMKIFVRQERKTTAVRSVLLDFIHNKSGRETGEGGGGGGKSCAIM